MSRYFWVVSVVDAEFTRHRWDQVGRPLPRDIKHRLRSVWGDSSSENELGIFFDYMPIHTDVWLINGYVQHEYLFDLPPTIMASYFADRRLFLFFYPPSRVVYEPDADKIAQMITQAPQDYVGWVLLEKETPQEIPASSSRTGEFNFEWGDWLYNYFNFDTTIPEHGWLTIGQLYDPAWEVTVDGKKVETVRSNVMTMAIPITSGQHSIHVEYRPFARKIYWPAGILLEISLVGLFGVALGIKTRRLR